MPRNWGNLGKNRKARYCSVRGCLGDKDPTMPERNIRIKYRPGEAPLRFFRVPCIISYRNSYFCGPGKEELHKKVIELSTIRQERWLNALGAKKGVNVDYLRVCGRHFVSGAPADLQDDKNVDWVPTLKLLPKNNPLGKAKFMINELVRNQKHLKKMRNVYSSLDGNSVTQNNDNFMEEGNESIESHDETSGTSASLESEGMEAALLQEPEVLLQELEVPSSPKKVVNAQHPEVQFPSKKVANAQQPKKVNFSKKGAIFADDEECDSKITNYMFNHPDAHNGHWHVQFCRKKDCLTPNEHSGHYHVHVCKKEGCVLPKSAENVALAEVNDTVKSEMKSQ